jgi:Holliday junction resolvasome RuvABC ATP-dependent DNA helicase subunit
VPDNRAHISVDYTFLSCHAPAIAHLWLNCFCTQHSSASCHLRGSSRNARCNFIDEESQHQHSTSHTIRLRMSQATRQLQKPARIILIGAPGVGKGTQSERLLSRFPQLASISSGDLLRENVRRRTPLGECDFVYVSELHAQ